VARSGEQVPPAPSEKRPYPLLKVNEFMVSKAYFVEAAKAYVHNNSTTLQWEETSFCKAVDGILGAFLTDVHLCLFEAWMIDYLLSLQRVTLCAAKAYELDTGTKHPFLDPFEDSDFLSIPHMPKVASLRGLKQFELELSELLEFEGSNDSHKQMLLANIDGLRAFLTPRVTQPKDPASDTSRRTHFDRDELYYGSGVSAPISSLLAGGRALLTKEALEDDDIPDSLDVEGLEQLVGTNASGLLRWIKSAKKRVKAQAGGTSEQEVTG
jgi:hypothetical protein